MQMSFLRLSKILVPGLNQMRALLESSHGRYLNWTLCGGDSKLARAVASLPRWWWQNFNSAYLWLNIPRELHFKVSNQRWLDIKAVQAVVVLELAYISEDHEIFFCINKCVRRSFKLSVPWKENVKKVTLWRVLTFTRVRFHRSLLWYPSLDQARCIFKIKKKNVRIKNWLCYYQDCIFFLLLK